MLKEEIKFYKEWRKGDNPKDIEHDIKQITNFLPHMCFKINGKGKNIRYYGARKIMTLEEFVSGIDRAVFHWDCIRKTKNNEDVFIDSHDYWDKILKEC